MLAERRRAGARAGVVVAETAVTELGDASNADAEASVADARDVAISKWTTVRCPIPDRRERLLGNLATWASRRTSWWTRACGVASSSTPMRAPPARCAPCSAHRRWRVHRRRRHLRRGAPSERLREMPRCEAICRARHRKSPRVFAVDLLGGVTPLRHAPPRRAARHPHTIWHKAQTMMKTDQVYER